MESLITHKPRTCLSGQAPYPQLPLATAYTLFGDVLLIRSLLIFRRSAPVGNFHSHFFSSFSRRAPLAVVGCRNYFFRAYLLGFALKEGFLLFVLLKASSACRFEKTVNVSHTFSVRVLFIIISGPFWGRLYAIGLVGEICWVAHPTVFSLSSKGAPIGIRLTLTGFCGTYTA